MLKGEGEEEGAMEGFKGWRVEFVEGVKERAVRREGCGRVNKGQKEEG